MASYDISKVDFDPRKHYSSVRMQQGRVFTDDDWNENERIENEERRRSRVDIIGPYGSPDNGFLIKNPQLTDGKIDFNIQSGILHLGGMRLEMDEMETFLVQKDWLDQNLSDVEIIPREGEWFDMVYLEAWQQPVSAIEDESLFEVALGGPDTTTRLRTMRRVKIFHNIGFENCAEAWLELQKQWKDGKLGTINREHERVPDVRLRVSFNSDILAQDLCAPSASGGYLGAENQAIRVQLVDSSHFIWGFDNVSPLYRATIVGSEITLITPPKDQYHWPINQVVELLLGSAVLPNGQKIAAQSGHFSKVNISFNPDTSKFSISTPPPADFAVKPGEYFFVRVWNRGEDPSPEVVLSFTSDVAVPLGNTGLEITITGEDRVAEDYWIITARPETPNTIIPWALTSPEGIPPMGVRRFFAPLAVIRWQNAVEVFTHDCRKKFNPLTEQDCCCTYTVGDGVESKGDFQSIQEAIDHLPDSGGKICVLRGIHPTHVSLIRRRNIRITGCGEHSVLIAIEDSDEIALPVFRINASEDIKIDNLTLLAPESSAIEVIDDKDSFSQSIVIQDNHITAGIHGIDVRVNENLPGDNNILILNNLISIINKEIGKAGIFCTADDVRIEKNRIIVTPDEDIDNPAEVNNNVDRPSRPNVFVDPCIKKGKAKIKRSEILFNLRRIYIYSKLYQPQGQKQAYQAGGGIQIGGGSEKIQIIDNEIIGGSNNGITLGQLSFQQTSDDVISPSDIIPQYLYDLIIERNIIQEMGKSGIGTQSEAHTRLVDTVIYRNKIQFCALQIPREITGWFVNQNPNQKESFGGISLTFCENILIRENQIEQNGIDDTFPICGIYILVGEHIDISDNRIINNGIRKVEGERSVRKGERGGIVIKMAMKYPGFEKNILTSLFTKDNLPIAKIHQNIVLQPLGHALYVIACGQVSVLGNQFISEGIDKNNPVSVLAGSVFLMNIGISKDLGGRLLANLATTNLSTRGDTLSQESQTLSKRVQFFPNGNTLFVNNQTTMDLRSLDQTAGFCSQLILSLGDIGFGNNQSENVGYFNSNNNPKLQRGDAIVVNTILISFSLRTHDNRFTDGFINTVFSLFSLGYMNTTTGNQATNCLIALGKKSILKDNIVVNEELVEARLNCSSILNQFSDIFKVPTPNL